jgi:hypothetical protein
MPKFRNSLHAWQSEPFIQAMKNDLEHLETGVLPLDKAVSQGGYVDDNNITATVLYADEDELAIHARVGIFFTEIVINCGCGDDPMETNAYCEMRISIDKTTAEAEFEVLQD